MARLGDIFTISSGGTPNKNELSYYEGGSIPWVKTGDLKNKYISKEIECITEEGLSNSSAKLFPRDTVLVAMYGATIGACSILPYEAATNQACAAFLPCEDVIPEYLFYFLSGKKDQFIKDGVGGAQPNISAGYLKNVKFELVSLGEQQKVIDRLSKVDDLISFRKQQLSKLDELVKARFIEMFGDPTTNSQGLRTNPLKDVLVLKAGDFTAASDISDLPTAENRYPCYGGNGIRGYVAECSQEGAYSLIGRQGALSGNVQYAKGRFKNTEHALLVTPIVAMNSIWLNQLLINLDLKRYQTGAAQPGLSVKNLQEIPIISVLLSEQDAFAAFVEQTDKSKLAIQKSLEKLETLKKALMQKYFG